MKKILLLPCCLVALATTLPARAAEQADSHPYLAIRAGITTLDDANLRDATGSVDAGFDNGISLALAAGYAVEPVRFELELGRRQNDIDTFSALGLSVSGSGEVTATTIMGHLFYDFTPAAGICPYLGLGAGMARIEVDDAAVAGISLGGDDDIVAAGRLLAGIGFQVAPQAFLDIAYRYTVTADPSFAGTKAEYSGHDLLAGVRIAF